MIDPQEVETAFLECLYEPEEIQDGQVPPNTVKVEGIMADFGFHPERLEQQRDKVKAWLKELPHEFRLKEGGGWSFLNACNQADGVQWTGLHQRMEQLFCLGTGLGLVKCLMPRDMWPALPGGMPYYAVLVED